MKNVSLPETTLLQVNDRAKNIVKKIASSLLVLALMLFFFRLKGELHFWAFL